MKKNITGAFLILAAFFFASCGGLNRRLTTEAVYFRNLNDSLLANATTISEHKISKGDILSVNIFTANATYARLLNPYTAASKEGEAAGTEQGYLVDMNGKITFPVLGEVHTEGLTKSELRDLVKKLALEKTVDDAIVSVRLLNYKITLLGEVNRPSSYNIPNEKVTIFDAIGLAGDLTVYGRRDNIRIIRENGDKKETGTININDGNVFNSPYYFLKQNDIVYVEMNERKMSSADQLTTRRVSIALAAVTAVSLIITTITRF